jgi:diketogulonate reductase-like aldo/keto reductase
MTHIDTAEAYGWGISEQIVGEVVAEYNRDEVFVTSKLLPIHVRYSQMKKATEKSLKRLNLKYFDMYLIHYPIPLIPIKRNMRLLEDLLSEGKTRYIGVSNHSLKKFQKAQECLKKAELVTNQLHINVVRQQHIINNLSFYQNQGVTLTSYSPLSHRGLTSLKGELRDTLEKIAKKKTQCNNPPDSYCVAGQYERRHNHSQGISTSSRGSECSSGRYSSI